MWWKKTSAAMAAEQTFLEIMVAAPERVTTYRRPAPRALGQHMTMDDMWKLWRAVRELKERGFTRIQAERRLNITRNTIRRLW